MHWHPTLTSDLWVIASPQIEDEGLKLLPCPNKVPQDLIVGTKVALVLYAILQVVCRQNHRSQQATHPGKRERDRAALFRNEEEGHTIASFVADSGE